MNVVFTGPECAGKTTLCNELSSLYGATCVKEMAREYLDIRNNTYTQESLYEIGLLQLWEEKTIQTQSSIVFYDTDLLTIIIWSQEKYNFIDHDLFSVWNNQKIDVYFLCRPDIPWVHDQQRESQYDRERLFLIYKRYLDENNKEYIVLEGDLEKRKSTAMQYLNDMAAKII